nr:hypothetical protein [Tolivirales sp.]
MNIELVTAPVAQIAGAYEFQRPKSVQVEIVPSGGSLFSGDMSICYITNSEIIAAFESGSDITRESIMYNEQGTQTFAMSQKATKKMDSNRIMTRKWYALNWSPSGSADDIDRTVPALLGIRYGVPAAAITNIPVVLMCRTTWEMTGLAKSSSHTLTHSLEPPAYPRIQFDTEVMPDKVILVARNGKEQAYVKEQPPKPSTQDC